MSNLLKKYPTYQPKLEDLAKLFNEQLKFYFENVEVAVVDCPDLTKQPFNLAAKGLCSSSTDLNKVLDVGGEKFIVPLARLDKEAYEIVKIVKDSGLKDRAHIVGAACGPYYSIGYNSELMANVAYENDEIINRTKCAYLPKRNSEEDPEYVLQNSPNTSFNILGNFYASEGLEGKVLKIIASKRKRHDYSQININGNLISVLRKILNENFTLDQPVSMGGIFLYKGNKAKLHIMPDFSKKPLLSSSDVQDWLKFYEFKGPLIAFTAFHSNNNLNLSLRDEHSHCYGLDSDNPVGGHYHYELDSRSAEYEAYLNIAGEIVRYDQHYHDATREIKSS